MKLVFKRAIKFPNGKLIRVNKGSLLAINHQQTPAVANEMRMAELVEYLCAISQAALHSSGGII